MKFVGCFFVGEEVEHKAFALVASAVDEGDAIVDQEGDGLTVGDARAFVLVHDDGVLEEVI